MRVLIACEFSGIVRDEFRARGHDAWSCDLLPSERDGPHYQEDALEVVRHRGPWGALVGFPPCTRLCNSGVRWLHERNLWAELDEACRFFLALWDSGVPKISLENPIMHRHAKERIKVDPIQRIQPWMFGHGETKTTCLWLRGLPLLQPTNIVEGRAERVHRMSPGPERWKERSRTLPGIAAAMAEQWGVQ